MLYGMLWMVHTDSGCMNEQYCAAYDQKMVTSYFSSLAHSADEDMMNAYVGEYLAFHLSLFFV